MSVQREYGTDGNNGKDGRSDDFPSFPFIPSVPYSPSVSIPTNSGRVRKAEN
jgi:hypothetical protein